MSVGGKENKVPRKRILVLDKNRDDIARVHEYLEAEGYEVLEAQGSEEAVARVEAGSVDLLVLDATDPAMDVSALCERFHSHADTVAIPIIAVTSARGDSDGGTAIHVGADDFMARPLDMIELIVRAKMLLRFKQMHDDLLTRNTQLQRVNKELARVNRELAGRNRELEQGMDMAHRLQEALLPQKYPRVKNISFCHLYTPADIIGGDLFQIAGMSNHRAALFLSDVSGHGIRAALVMSIVKTVFEHVYLEDKDAAQVLCDMNSRFRSVLGQLTPAIFATAFVLIVDGANCRLSLASAGHPCPLLIRKEDMSCEPLMRSDQIGPAFGFFSEPAYKTVEHELSHGDIAIGFTDGVYEVREENGQMFGLDRLQRLIAENARLIPRDLIQKIVVETDEFRGSRPRTDDICLVALEVS